jgi:hypothetical protein
MNDRDGTALMRMEGWNCTAAAPFLFISLGCTDEEGAVIFESFEETATDGGSDDDSDAPPRGDDDDDRKPAL